MEINNRFLFKAKRIDNGEWVQGSYYVFMGKHYIFEHPFESDNLTHQIDESTICQCTGVNPIISIPLFIGTKNMHLGHLKEKAGYMITFLEKQKIRRIV